VSESLTALLREFCEMNSGFLVEYKIPSTTGLMCLRSEMQVLEKVYEDIARMFFFVDLLKTECCLFVWCKWRVECGYSSKLEGRACFWGFFFW
jgi:hypothetical protein